MVKHSRQAGVLDLQGTFAFEALRRIAGDEAATDFLLIDYQLPQFHAGTSDVMEDAIDIGERDWIDGCA